MKTRVLNKYFDKIPIDAIYIGRPSRFGNPYIIGKDGDRKEVIQKYIKYVLNNAELFDAIKTELANKDLVCFCAPKLCHGHVIMDIINGIYG